MTMDSRRLSEDLMLAIASNSIDIFGEILSHPEIDVNIGDSRGHQPLITACAYGRLDMAQALVQRGADVSYRMPMTKTTALHVASSNGFADIVELLLAHGADRNARDFSGSSPLDYAEVPPVTLIDSEASRIRSDAADERLNEMRRYCLDALGRRNYL